jgi:hypothetical protein
MCTSERPHSDKPTVTAPAQPVAGFDLDPAESWM